MSLRINMKIAALTSMLVLLALTNCWAVQPYTPVHPDPVLEPWRWRSFPELKGLGLQCLAEDRNGNIWFGINHGVMRYDGINWTSYPTSLSGGPVQSLCATRDGRLYAGTALGISRFRDGQWDRVFPNEGACQVFDLLEASDGSLWAGTSLGAIHFSEEQIRLYTTDSLRTARPELEVTFVMLPKGAENQVYDVYEDKEGRMWFGLFDGEILRYDIGATELSTSTPWRLYTAEDGLDIGHHPRIAQTPDQIIWTVSSGSAGGVNRFDGQAWTHFRLSDANVSLNSNPSILVTRGGTLWVGGHWSNLYAYRDGSWTNYIAPDVATPSGRLSDLLEASDGTLWVAGRREKAVRLDLGTSRWTTFEGLRFRCETSDGSLWFVSQDSGVVRYDGRTWTRYGAEDGLMAQPTTLIEGRTGVLWAAGSQDSTAATARFDGTKWSVQTHPALSRNIYPHGIYAASDGSMWFSGSSNPLPERGHLSGLLRFNGKTWIHYTPPEAPWSAYGIAQTSDGSLWFGGSGLHRFDGETWTRITEPEGLSAYVEGVYRRDDDNLWVGTRSDGVFRFDGQTWQQYTERDGLAASWVGSILQTKDGSIWAATWAPSILGISRFDGQTWTPLALPSGLSGENLWQSQDGALWFFGWGRGSIRYRPDIDPPETEITLALDEVSQPGNTTLTWKGTDVWRDTPDEALQYAWRLDKGAWSVYSGKTNDVFLALASGDHIFEVRARDRDFNEDPTPATIQFTVIPPVWQQAWFIGIIVIFLSAVGLQTTRVVRRDKRLSIANHELLGKTDGLENANRALSDANKQLFGLNRELQQERLVERIRGEVQAMEKADDFDNLLSTLATDLKGVGLHFTTCGIDVLDEPIDTPTMPHFETHGFHYTAYTIDPDGIVSRESYHIPAPFPPVNLETIERFIAGEPWQGMSSDTAIVEIPIAQYGRLRLTAPQRDAFTDDEIETLQDFATAIALGYTRYLDFVNLETANKEIQTQTQRKSDFLASMSHELRTPITAMKGFVDNILDGIGGKPNERHERYLTRVTDNASRLLDLVNNLLDLSKIEAGRMDVEVNTFLVKDLTTSCCGTVEPLVQSGVSLVQEVANEADEVNTDEGKFRHVIGNLLSNAVKFTKEGEIAVRAKTIHDQLVISVSDTGIGMPAEALNTIFDEFQQVEGSEQKQKGTGLGLAITKKYTELLGGTISVESEVGKGTTFTVRVPKSYE